MSSSPSAASPTNADTVTTRSGQVTPSLGVTMQRHRHETTLRIRGEVDLSTRARFEEALNTGLAVAARTLTIDLRAVTFIGCGGLEVLAQAAQHASYAGRSLHVIPGAATADLAELLGGWVDIDDGVVAADSEQPSVQSALTVGVDEPRTGGLVLHPDGEVDMATVGVLGDVVDAVLSDAARTVSGPVVVGLDRLRFMSAAGARVLSRASARARETGVAFRLAGGPPVVRRILVVTGADATLEHHESVDEALGPTDLRSQPLGEARGRRRDDYAHLTPRFTERTRLAPDDPRQQYLRAQLITGFLPVAHHVARKYRYRGENLDDLEQVATIGLINAIDRFEPDRGPDFLSYAIPTINGELQRHYRDRTSTIRVPRPIRELQSRLFQAADAMSQKMGRAATPSELATHLDVGLDLVIEALQAAYEARPSSLDQPHWAEDPGSGEASRVGDAVGGADPEFDLVENRESLLALLDGLPERERRIVLLRFYGNMTQAEIASRIGISQMHVSRLLASTLTQLRRQLAGE